MKSVELIRISSLLLSVDRTIISPFSAENFNLLSLHRETDIDLRKNQAFLLTFNLLTFYRRYHETDEVKKELIEFKARERRILQDRERLAREALSLVQAQWIKLPERVTPEPDTAAYRRWIQAMKKEEKEGRIVVERIKYQRKGFGAIDSIHAREQEREYKRSIVAIEKLQTLLNSLSLTDRHIESLRLDSLQMLHDIMMSFLEDDEERHDCKLCDEVFCSNRLRKEDA